MGEIAGAVGSRGAAVVAGTIGFGGRILGFGQKVLQGVANLAKKGGSATLAVGTSLVGVGIKGKEIYDNRPKSISDAEQVLADKLLEMAPDYVKKNETFHHLLFLMTNNLRETVGLKGSNMKELQERLVTAFANDEKAKEQSLRKTVFELAEASAALDNTEGLITYRKMRRVSKLFAYAWRRAKLFIPGIISKPIEYIAMGATNGAVAETFVLAGLQSGELAQKAIVFFSFQFLFSAGLAAGFYWVLRMKCSKIESVEIIVDKKTMKKGVVKRMLFSLNVFNLFVIRIVFVRWMGEIFCIAVAAVLGGNFGSFFAFIVAREWIQRKLPPSK